MAVQYDVFLECENGEISVVRTFNNESDSSTITEDISKIQEMCEHFSWNEPRLSQKIGTILFTIVNGDNQLKNALKEADAVGELLQVFIRQKGAVPDLPFELLYDSHFLAPSKVHIIRHVSNYGHKKKVEPEDRPLTVLFMACSPQDASPVLDFEKEEETILDVTKDLPIVIDVEDTGSLQGLKDHLIQNEYDVIHLTGHADIEDGIPYFCMENEEGFKEKVTPLQLQNTLNEALKRPRLVFLSGCKTGQALPSSFAHDLVVEHSPTVVGWGLPVTDPAATTAAAHVYRELSRGKSITDAVFFTRQVLYNNKFSDWSLLRLFSDGTPLHVPLVKKGQKKKVKARDIQYAYLLNSQVKVLKKGFVGRRRQIQKGIRTFKKDEEKVGLLLHGTGGLGKSCLAGKFCERFKDYALIVVHGELNAVTLLEALKQGFMRAEDEKGLQIVKEDLDIVDKIMKLCSTCFQERSYLIVLDDFEKNLKGYEQGDPVVSDEAAPIVGTLLQGLPLAVKSTQVIITSRYTFPFIVEGKDLVTEKLEPIGLTSFRGADERKKIFELEHIRDYPKEDVRKRLIEAGRGNPRLMEVLDALLTVEKDLDVIPLLEKVKGEQEEFIQGLILREILQSQPENFQKVLQYSSGYRLPVLKEGIHVVCNDVKDWQSFVDVGVQLSLMEEGKSGDTGYYWVTPLLREEIFEKLSKKERMWCHKAAVAYYRKYLSLVDGYLPVYAFELIEHALQCDLNGIALEEGSRLLSFLRETLAYREALSEGAYTLSHMPESMKDEKFSLFLYQLGWIHLDVGNVGEAITYFEKALKIDRKIYGDNHPDVARDLNILGGAWDALGDAKKAIDYYEKALKIDRKIYGDNHPDIATRLNNLGGAWGALGDAKKAIGYYEKALKIDRKIYGDNHPSVATYLNNLGLAWRTLGDAKKAVDYYEKALSIFRETYGENHPYVATTLNNLGLAWNTLGDAKKAIDYYEKALKIDRKIYGDNHPSVATYLNNLGSAWNTLGDSKKAIEYIQQAYAIFQKVYGDDHPHTRTVKESLDALKNSS